MQAPYKRRARRALTLALGQGLALCALLSQPLLQESAAGPLETRLPQDGAAPPTRQAPPLLAAPEPTPHAHEADLQRTSHPPAVEQARPQHRARYVLLGVDCFGQLGPRSCEDLRDVTGLEPGQTLEWGWTGGDTVERLQRSGPYASVTLSPVFYPNGGAYVTIDVVSAQQKQRRQLRAAPGGEVALPVNLLELYGEFTHTWMELFAAGVAVQPSVKEGRWEFDHEALRPYADLFRREVPRHRDTLIQILDQDHRHWRRQGAAGLLGFDRSSQQTRTALSAAMLDPHGPVRSEAARALQPHVQATHHDGAAPMELLPTLAMLRLPSSADRANACALLARLAQRPTLRASILEHGAPTLLQMLAARRPGARGQALEVLQHATGRRDIGPDAERWRTFLQI